MWWWSLWSHDPFPEVTRWILSQIRSKLARSRMVLFTMAIMPNVLPYTTGSICKTPPLTLLYSRRSKSQGTFTYRLEGILPSWWGITDLTTLMYHVFEDVLNHQRPPKLPQSHFWNLPRWTVQDPWCCKRQCKPLPPQGEVLGCSHCTRTSIYPLNSVLQDPKKPGQRGPVRLSGFLWWWLFSWFSPLSPLFSISISISHYC